MTAPQRRLLRDARGAPARPRRDRSRELQTRGILLDGTHRGRQAAAAAADLLRRRCSARCSSSSSSARATTASAKATSRRCSSRSSATRSRRGVLRAPTDPSERMADARRHGPDRYQSGFGNEFATEALAGRAAGRPQLAAALPLRPLRRAAVRHRLHRAARRQPPLAGCTASARRRCTGRSSAIDAGRIVSDFGAEPTPPNQLRWNPLPMPDDADRLRRRPGARWPATATRTRRPAPRRTSTPPTARCSGASSTTPTASC